MNAAAKLGLVLWVQIGAIFASASANDDFATRLPIVTNSVVTNAFLSTLEPGEPTHGANFTTGSIWWAWTPPNTGTYRIQCIVPNTGSALAIYTGTNLMNLKVSATSEGSVVYWGRVLIDFHAVAGVEYAIAATYIPIDDSPLLLEIHTPPVHDSFSAALPLTLNVPRTNKFVVATLEPGEAAAVDRGSVWYTWTAPHSGSFIFSTHLLSGYYDNTLSIYTGSGVTNLTRIPSFEYQSNATLAISFRAQQSVSYHLSLEMLTSPYERTVTATILSGHPHDALTNAAPLSGLFAAWTNTMFGATSEPGEEVLSPHPSVWSQWTAPESGSYKIALPYGYRPGVYRGSNITELVKVAAASGTNATLTFLAEAGVTYKFRSSHADYGAAFSLRLGPPASNESLATATELTGDNFSLAGQNWTLTTAPSSARRIWYRWTAPPHGIMTISSATNISIIGYHTKIPTLNSNLLLSGLTQDGSTSGTNAVGVTAGVAYYFGLHTPFSTNIPFNLRFDHKPAYLGDLSGALVGGDALWSLQTNIFFSPPDAFQVGPLSPFQSAYLEFDVYGPGILKFRTKITSVNYPGSLIVQGVRAGSLFNIGQYQGVHDWTLRTIDIISSYTVLRWTATSSDHTSSFWLDDIEFIPAPPRAPHLTLDNDGINGARLSFGIQGQHTITIDTSTNLIEWLPWTNLFSPSSVSSTLPIPAPTNNTPQFFRASVVRLNAAEASSVVVESD